MANFNLSTYNTKCNSKLFRTNCANGEGIESEKLSRKFISSDFEREIKSSDKHCLVTQNDVLWGRTKLAHGHPGNTQFRRYIKYYRATYQSTKSRDAKSVIIKSIMAAISKAGGRFLRSVDDEGQDWYEVDWAQAYEKVSHALRSARPSSNNHPSYVRPMTIESHVVPVTPPRAEHGTFDNIFGRQQTILSSLAKENGDELIMPSQGTEHNTSPLVTDDELSLYDDHMIYLLGQIFGNSS